MSQLRFMAQARYPKRFTSEEDALLTRCMRNCETPDWKYIASKFHNRTARQVRERWNIYLSPTNYLGPWTDEEDKFLMEKINEVGLKWSLLHECFKGRTQMSIKNRWNTHLSKRAIQDKEGKFTLRQNFVQNKEQIRITKQVARQQMAIDILYQSEKTKSSVNLVPKYEDIDSVDCMDSPYRDTFGTMEDEAFFSFSPDSIFLN